MRLAIVPLFLLLAAAAPASAQPTDPIGALLDHRDEEPDDPDEAAEELAPLPPYPPPKPPGPSVPGTPVPARPRLTAPVRLEETGKTPDAPPTVDQIAYDTRLKASAASAQGFQGPLDGGWTLAARDAGDLYALQLVDQPDRLEGAWRDLRRRGALGASGLVDDIRRTGQDLTLRFSGDGAAAVTAVLHGTEDGRWSGELTEGGKRRAVVLRRQNP